MNDHAMFMNRREGLDSGSIHTGSFASQLYERVFDEELSTYLSLTYDIIHWI